MIRGFCVACVLVLCAAGCNSPYYADRGALFGGVTGAGVGAIVGNALGNTGAGAAIGAATGVLAGAAVGSGMDEMEARNRAMIEERLGRQIAIGAVTIPDVVAMTHAGVSEELIVSHIQTNGFAGHLQANDLIYLQQSGVSTRVIQVMQAPPQPVIVQGPPMVAAPPPVIVEEHYYGGPYWEHHHHHRHHRPHGGVHWGVSIAH